MQDIMVDLETTGTDPVHSGIIQIAAVRFDYKTGAVGDTFNRCLFVPGYRSWNLQTREWWEKQKDDKGKSILEKITARSEDPHRVFYDFTGWAVKEGTPRMWAKPISFEFPFISHYLRDLGIGNPFHYRESVDVNSFVRGMFQDPSHDGFDKVIPFDGDAHDAIFDVFHQIKAVLYAKEQHANAARTSQD